MTIRHLLVLSVLLFSQIALAVDPVRETNLFVLDMDRMVVPEKAAIYDATDPREYVGVGGVNYRIAPYLPEFLAALHKYFRQVLPTDLKFAIFSTGFHARNASIVSGLKLSGSLGLSDLVPILDVKSFYDLTRVQSWSPTVELADIISFYESQPRADRVPFYDIFTKDLNIFPSQLDRIVIFDDTINATPLAQSRNLLVLARPDIDEQRVHRSRYNQDHFWLPQGQRDPLQMARSKYRLVRAIGLLGYATKMYVSGTAKSLPDALNTLQWTREGKYRAELVNSQDVYRSGMQILELMYKDVLHPDLPAQLRRPGYFTFQPVLPRLGDCEATLRYPFGALPWSAPPNF